MGFTIDAVELKTVEMVLGRSISEDANKLLSYQEISDADLNDLRLLANGGTINAASYLLHCLDGKRQGVRSDIHTFSTLRAIARHQSPLHARNQESRPIMMRQ